MGWVTAGRASVVVLVCAERRNVDEVTHVGRGVAVVAGDVAGLVHPCGGHQLGLGRWKVVAPVVAAFVLVLVLVVKSTT